MQVSGPMPNRGWYGMACWNGLSPVQQRMLIEDGVLPFGHWQPEGGTCERGAMVAIEIEGDESPGPRFYCLACALGRLIELARAIDTDT
jgi:hypothetical protein